MSTTKDETAKPKLVIVDSDPIDSEVAGLETGNQGSTTDPPDNVLPGSSMSLTEKREDSAYSTEKDEHVDASVGNSPSEAEVSDDFKANVEESTDDQTSSASDITKSGSMSVLVDVLVTTDSVAVYGKELKTESKAEESLTSQETSSEVKTDSEKSVSSKSPTKEDKVVPAKVTSPSLKMNIKEAASAATISGSGDDNDITPPVSCFNWFKPQRLMSKLKSKREKSHKTDLPSLTSAVSDPSDLEPEAQPEESGKYYEDIFIAILSLGSKEGLLERIDYASLAEDKIIPAYLGSHSCYDVMPTSGKVIILSVELLVKNAFSALVSNDIKAAPLWDATVFDFVGMLTISDFINVLRHYYYSNPVDIKDIESQSIATWRRITAVTRTFVKVNSSESLVQATKLLIQESVHRLPVFDEKRQSVLFVLTRKRLLHFLSNSLFENFEKTNIKTPSFFRKTIGELKVGTFENIATVNINSKVIEALDLFVNRNVSSLPVVDENNVLLDIFEKFDVFQLAKEQTYHNLDMEINEAISKAGVRETAWICTMKDTFGTVINRFVNNKVHRIVVIDDVRAVLGIISLSDVLKFLVIDPLENSGLSSTTETIDEASEGAVGGSGINSSLESSHKAASLDDDSSAVSEGVASLKIDDSNVE